MFGWLRSTFRHPLYPALPVTHAAAAKGRHAVLAGSLQELAQAACRGACASRAVFILQLETAPPPGSSQREQLWKWFPVPSYVLLLDAAGQLKAYECEAREGLHLAADCPGDGRLESTLCPCGRPGRRVDGIQELAGHAGRLITRPFGRSASRFPAQTPLVQAPIGAPYPTRPPAR